jgi:hypothetical protein
MGMLFRSLQGMNKCLAILEMFLRSLQTSIIAYSHVSALLMQPLQGARHVSAAFRCLLRSLQGAADCCSSSMLSETGSKACIRHCAALQGPWHMNRSLAAVLRWHFLCLTAASPTASGALGWDDTLNYCSVNFYASGVHDLLIMATSSVALLGSSLK